MNLKYKKICAHCGEEFETNSPQKIYCNRPHYRPCPICGTPVKMIDNDFTRPPKCCSSECSHKLRQQKMKPRKCVECGKTFIPKSGVNTICDGPHFRKCVICGKEFEVSRRDIHDNITACSSECKLALQRQHNLENYGVTHPMQLKEVRAKLQNTMLEKYGVEHALQNKKLSEKQQGTAYKTNMEHNGVPYACMLTQCMNAQGRIISNINIKVGHKIEDLGLEYSFEKKLGNRSYDICIDSIRTLIEINPTYTHNTHGNHWGEGLDPSYHIEKTRIAQAHGYRCIHIFDWDDIDRVVRLLAPTKKIYARDCSIYKIYPKYGDSFLNDNHLQGTCRGQTLYLGLVKDKKLYQIITFGKPRYDKKHDVELLRLCTLEGYTVVGGSSKLFSFATKRFGLNNIISYCDISKFSGDVYTKIGMKKIRTSPPQEVWSRDGDKITANLLRQRGYDQLFKTNYGKGTSNEQLMLEHGWLPVHDCGQAVYEFKE